jgi:protein-S-isoprenylcysteine O-methyltransferase Ste14
MHPPEPVSASSSPQPVLASSATLQIGRFKLTGVHAVIALILVVTGIAALIVHAHPSSHSVPLFLSAALWIAFLVYWGSRAHGARPAERAESRESRRNHEWLLNAGFLFLFVPIPALNGPMLPDSAVVATIGLIVQASGGLLGVWARHHLAENWSAAVSSVAGQELVRSGPYRLIRHPIYAAMIQMFVGSAVVSGRWHALLAVAIVALAYRRKIRIEESHLLSRFGPAYDAYRKRSWALVPGLL